MFGFFKPDIEFFTFVDGLEQIAPIKKASNFLPEWWKKIDKNDGQTFTSGIPDELGNIKKCPGISDYMLSGFVLTSWTDIVVTPMDDYNCEVRPSLNLPLAIHTMTQSSYKPYLPDPINDQFKHIIKLQTPWLVKTKSNIDTFIDDPFYFFNTDFIVFPGIMNFHQFHTLTLQIMVKSKKPFMIPFGSPLALIRPVKRKKYPLKINTDTVAANKLLQISSLVQSCRFSSSNMYNTVRQKNKCPFS